MWSVDVAVRFWIVVSVVVEAVVAAFVSLYESFGAGNNDLFLAVQRCGVDSDACIVAVELVVGKKFVLVIVFFG